MRTIGKQEQLQLTGGNTVRKDRRELDFYPTPANVTIALMEWMRQRISTFETPCTIWEPACGDGAMVKVLKNYNHSVISTDIQMGQDFLKMPSVVCDAIITNPPFEFAEDFIRKACVDAPIVAMLLKSQYWHRRKSVNLFNTYKPQYNLALTWRPDFLEHERIDGSLSPSLTKTQQGDIFNKQYFMPKTDEAPF